MRRDQKAIQDAWEEIWRNGHGNLAASLATKKNGTRHVDISPAPRTRLEIKPGEEMKAKKRLDKNP